ncbi:MAG TPA: tetratricopeptide repeat protein [Bacteroidales bacterium]|nr:tetratricopeptide repeat protein [Bacteroidales bacterium]HQG56799.1 tetratricopeptide repeat protein [Bacteroidales bacterium]HRR93893.1 tetratricopeptide repeat protein [Bacteroidales bacterium]HRT89852.1 tetratricopeptide repeat protein [Bacteroidales bacterium]
MKAIDYSYFIEKYLAGEMDQQERNWFNSEIEGNEYLQREIMLRRKTDEMLRKQDVIKLRSRLSAIGEEYRKKEAQKLARRKMAYRSAAVIAALVMVGSMFIYINRMQSPASLFNHYFSLYEAGDQARSNNASGIDPIYSKALSLYNNNDFENAAKLFKEFIYNSPGNMEARLIYGISEMKNRNFPEAEKSFSAILDDGNNYFLDNARWYLALCYINTGKTEAAKNELNAVRSSGSVYSKKAAKLLKRVK